MYKNIYVDRKTNTLHVWDDVGGYNSVQYQDYAYRKKDNGKYRSLYGDPLEKTTYFSPKDPSLFESDVPLDTKFLIDLYGDSDSPSTGIRTGIIDIETDISDGFPTVEKGDKTITAIALYDYISKKYIAYLLDTEQRTNIPNTDTLEVICCDNEYSLLDKFLQKWQEFAWDVVTSWNGNGFDMPYLYHRISNVMGRDNACRLSPIGICYINKYNHRLVIAGISHLDYMELFKKYMDKKEPSYALNPIGKKYVNLGKIEFTGSLDDLYKTDIAKYIEYNINDVKIIVELDKKFQFIELARKICHVGHVSYENFEMSSRYLEGAILVYMRRNGNLIAPNKSLEGQAEYLEKVENDEEGFSGAYVKDPIPGRYDWIYDLDLTSMYPNIIISLNISPETKVCKIENWDAEQYANGTLEKVFIMGQGYSMPEFKEFIHKHKFSIASNGCIYSTDKRGIIPSILIKWFDERKEMRKLAKKYADEKNWEQYDFYDQRQKVQKIMLNSAYGALGLSVFRFYDRDNAEAVTTTGVTIIKSAAKAANSYYNDILKDDVDYIIYIDTDSLFLSALPIVKHTMPYVDINDETQMTSAILKVCSDVQSFVNKQFHVMAETMFNIKTHRFDAKQEVIAKTGFWIVKKRYAQKIINKGGIECDEMEVKGIDVVRTSFPIKFREVMKTFLVDLLDKRDETHISNKLLEFKKQLDTVPIIELAKNTSVKFISLNKITNYDPPSRSPFNYIKGSPPQVKGALYYNDLISHLKLNKRVQKIMSGQKIKWVYVKENTYGIDSIAMKADGTDPIEILDFIEKYVDRTAMYNKELRSKIEEFYHILNWIYPDENTENAKAFFDF